MRRRSFRTRPSVSEMGEAASGFCLKVYSASVRKVPFPVPVRAHLGWG